MNQSGFTTFIEHAPGLQVRNEDMPVLFEDIASRTGIHSRNVADPDETVENLGLTVLRKFFDRLGITGRDCAGLILASYCDVTSVIDDFAKQIARVAEINGPAIGINYACSGFPAATRIALDHFPNTDKHVVIVCVEMLSRIIDWKDMSTAILFGDRAAATSVHRQGRHKILESWAERVRDDNDLITLQDIPDAVDVWGDVYPRKCVVMKGRPLYRMAPQRMYDLSLQSMQRLGFQPQELAIIAQHQANGKFATKLRNLLNSANLLHVEVTNEIRHAGNVASASIPCALLRIEDQLCNNKITACPAVGASPDFEVGALSHGIVVFRSEDK